MAATWCPSPQHLGELVVEAHLVRFDDVDVYGLGHIDNGH